MTNTLPDDFAQLHRAEVARRMNEHARATTLTLTNFPMAATSPWVGHYVGIDVSDWQPNIDWAYLAAAGVHFGIAKAFEIQEGITKDHWPQKTYANAIQGMYDAKMMSWGYMFQNGYSIAGEGPMSGYTLGAVRNMKTTESPEYQYTVQAMTNKASYYSPKGVLSGWMIDVERWWQSYVEYNDYLHGGRTIDKVKIMEPTFIMADLENYIDLLTTAMSKGNLPQIPLMIYTGKWYTDAYLVSSGQNLFYNQAPHWKAAGVTVCTAGYTVPATTSTWDQLLAGANLPAGAPFDAGFGAATMWQFSGGSLKLPNGKYGNTGLDLDLATVNDGQFDALFGAAPAPTPPPAATYTITGTVTPALTGVSIALGTLSTVTNLDGMFTLSNIPAGTTGSLTPTLTGYTFNPVTIPVNVNASITGQNFTATAVVNPPPVNPDLAALTAEVEKLKIWAAGIGYKEAK